jgi:hypothetical protein
VKTPGHHPTVHVRRTRTNNYAAAHRRNALFSLFIPASSLPPPSPPAPQLPPLSLRSSGSTPLRRGRRTPAATLPAAPPELRRRRHHAVRAYRRRLRRFPGFPGTRLHLPFQLTPRPGGAVPRAPPRFRPPQLRFRPPRTAELPC